MAWPYLLPHAITVVSVTSSVLASYHLFSSRRSSQSTVAWLLGFVFMPLVTVPLYIVFGTRKIAHRLALRPQDGPPPAEPAPSHPIERVLFGAGIDGATSDNDLRIVGDGVAAFEALVALLEGATSRIFISIFILGDDDTGRAIVEILSRRAKDGLDVRLIVDAVGSRSSVRWASRALKAAGGQARTFMPLLRIPFRGSGNLRSHRKLVVVDGARVLTGGMNFALEYMGSKPYAARFRDIAAIATGTVAMSAERLFLADWRFCSGEPRDATDAHATNAGTRGVGSSRLQFVPSGPDRPDDALYDGLLVAIGGARKRVRVVTPYYIPDDPLQRALVLSARRGIETDLVMPARSNHRIADVARRPFLRELAASGARLFAYPDGMVHAKAMVVDDTFAYVGSPNLDVRSLLLNYENAIFAYGVDDVAKIDAFIETLARECVRDGFLLKRRAWPMEPLARLLAPEL